MEQIVIKRFDTFNIPRVKKTQDGFIEGDACAGRPGVFPYQAADGSIYYELRHPEDVFHTDSLATLKMLPVTDDHPSDFVTAVNASKLQKGFTGENYRIDDNKIITPIKITDADLVRKIVSGQKNQLSYGYECLLKKEDGVYEGQKYTYRQINIRYNHLAVVPFGRAGNAARLRFDSKDYKEVAECIFDKDINNIEDNKNMSDEKVNHTDKELEVKLARFDALVAERKLAEFEKDSWKVKHDSLQELIAKKDAEIKELTEKSSPEYIAKKSMDRALIIMGAAKAMGEDAFAYVKHSDREIMETALNHKEKKYNFDGYSDEYVKGIFESQFGQVILPKKKTDAEHMLGALAKMTDSAIKTPASNNDIAASINKKQAELSTKA